tara:strand:+ start:864 stop:1091 length:228 start_codon:yes stop_codon:yes gene_type:complete
MNWIDVKERTPKQGEKVLVFGFKETELGGKKYERTIGLVEWKNETSSNCADVCHYYMEYSEITHWCKIPEEPNCK